VTREPTDHGPASVCTVTLIGHRSLEIASPSSVSWSTRPITAAC
jgi:hypothetical protein